MFFWVTEALSPRTVRMSFWLLRQFYAGFFTRGWGLVIHRAALLLFQTLFWGGVSAELRTWEAFEHNRVDPYSLVQVKKYIYIYISPTNAARNIESTTEYLVSYCDPHDRWKRVTRPVLFLPASGGL